MKNMTIINTNRALVDLMLILHLVCTGLMILLRTVDYGPDVVTGNLFFFYRLVEIEMVHFSTVPHMFSINSFDPKSKCKHYK